MANYLGDINLGDTLDTKFCTVNTSGVPTQLAGTPAVAAYPDDSITEITAGITLTVDFDARTGLNHVRVVATGANGYAAGVNYQLVITAGTVSGSSVVGYVIGEFSIEKRSALRPTTAGRTLDVSATGEAGVDWANVGGQAASVNLSATTVNLTNTATNVTTVNGLAANVVTAASIATDAIGAAQIAAGAITSSEAPNLDVAVSSRLAPTVAGRTLDVTATGAAGIDWANVEGQAAAVTLSATTVNTVSNLTTNNDKTGYAIGVGGIASTAFAAGAIDAAAIAADAITSSEVADSATPRILKNTALNNFAFLMVDSTDHVTPKTGLTWAAGSAQRSIDGAAFVNTTNLPLEIGSGMYKIDLAAADLNGDVVILKFTGTGADTRLIVIYTQPV